MQILGFNNVLISPYTELLGAPRGLSCHRGGPDWPDWDRQTAARHCRDGQPVDTRPQPARPIAELSFPAAWGGAIVRHFGHQISDFSMRILPTLSERGDLPLLFASSPENVATIAEAPAFFWSILDWFGVTPEKALFVDRPLVVKELLVAPQAEQPGNVAPSNRHLDRLDNLVHRRFSGMSRHGIVYVSRAQQITRFAGERYLETVMSLCGITVIRPEELPLLNQLCIYIGAQDLIFAEGSAMHAVQLLGRSLSNVTVLVRRKGWAHIKPSLQPRCTHLRYLDFSTGLICGIGNDGKPTTYSGLTILDGDAVSDWLCSIDKRCRHFWRSESFSAARDDDVRWWVRQRMVASPRNTQASRNEILSRLERCGLSHLVNEMTQLLDKGKA